MSAVAVASACVCGSIGADPSVVRFCDADGHHKYWRGDQRLTSVSKVISAVWPVKKDFESAPPEVLAHARERGIRVDRYFSEWLRTGRVRIVAPEWREVIAGVEAVIGWWQSEGIRDARPQVILAGEQEAGTADVLAPLMVAELKCVSALEPTYDIQVGAYVDFLQRTNLQSIDEGFILHCKIDAKTLTAKVKAVPVDLQRAVWDWRCLRDVWRVAQRRAPKKIEEAQ